MVVPGKRKLMVTGAAIAAAFAVPGCAGAGYKPTGAKNLTCVPAVSKPVAPPAGIQGAPVYSY